MVIYHCYEGILLLREKIISTLDEVFNLVNDYSGRKLFYRGENKNYGKTSCLPGIFRENPIRKINSESVDDRDNNRLAHELETMGIGIPYWPRKESDTPSWSWRLWGEEKLQALMKHYAPDFEQIKNEISKTDSERAGAFFLSAYLDVTSDIMTALHFACSQFCFYGENEEIPPETKTPTDGYLYVFCLSGIRNTGYLKLVNFPSYSHFYKNGETMNFQPFDRITHQRGAFLAPGRDEKRVIIYERFYKEIKEVYLSEKIIIKSGVKQKLYEVFGGKNGLNYYFPKIPLLSENNCIFQAYQNLKGITLLEKNDF